MRNLFFTLFAISLAAVAAMTATTAMLNAPVRQALPAVSTLTQADPAPPAQSGNAPASTSAGDTDTPAAAGAPKPAADGSAEAKPATDDEGDKDPYEGIAPEELPPDMQFSADSSVSFPTNI